MNNEIVLFEFIKKINYSVKLFTLSESFKRNNNTIIYSYGVDDISIPAQVICGQDKSSEISKQL